MKNLFLCFQKNSIKFLEKQYENVKDTCDLFFYVDNGSNDGSYEYLLSLSQKDPRVKVKSYISEKFEERYLRNMTYQWALQEHGISLDEIRSIVYFDGDEMFSDSLKTYFTEVFTHSGSGKLLVSGWQHLASENKQHLNRRGGRMARIFNPAKNLDIEFSRTGRRIDYHIESFPVYFHENKKSHIKCVFPIDHYGFIDQDEMERRRHHHKVLCEDSSAEYRLIDYPERVFAKFDKTYEQCKGLMGINFSNPDRNKLGVKKIERIQELIDKTNYHFKIGFFQTSLISREFANYFLGKKFTLFTLPYTPYLFASNFGNFKDLSSWDIVYNEQAQDNQFDLFVAPSNPKNTWESQYLRFLTKKYKYNDIIFY